MVGESLGGRGEQDGEGDSSKGKGLRKNGRARGVRKRAEYTTASPSISAAHSTACTSVSGRICRSGCRPAKRRAVLTDKTWYHCAAEMQSALNCSLFLAWLLAYVAIGLASCFSASVPSFSSGSGDIPVG